MIKAIILLFCSITTEDRIILPLPRYDVALSVETYINTYHTDRKVADAKYKGKQLLIRGMLSHALKPIKGLEYNTIFSTHDHRDYAIAIIANDDIDKVLKRKEGIETALLCKGIGMPHAVVPYLGDCKVIE